MTERSPSPESIPLESARTQARVRAETAPGVVSLPWPAASSVGPADLAHSGLRKQSSQVRRILCYGDSLTAGFCDNGRRFTPYGHALKESLKAAGLLCEVVICGLSGLTAKQMVADSSSQAIQDVTGQFGRGLARILNEDGPFDLVIIMAGTNDLGQGSPVKAAFDSACRLHALCHSRGIPTVALAPPLTPRTPSLKEARCSIKNLLEQWKRNAATHCQALIDPEELIPRMMSAHWEADEIHFSPSGSHALGQQVASLILPLLKKAREGAALVSNACPEQRFAKSAVAPANRMIPTIFYRLGA